MWNEKKSAALSQIIVVFLGVCLIASMIFAPNVVQWFVGSRTMKFSGLNAEFLVSFYIACIPAAILLACLFGLLSNIRRDEVFVKKNITYLRVSSWCCIVVAVICCISSLYYFPFGLVAVAAGFMALIIRVIKNVFAKAIILQDEADYTI